MVNRVMEWFRTLFGTPSSSSVAKERLRLVLLSDHLALAPDVIEAMRRDIFDVISRYVEVDEAHSDVSFEHKDEGIAMLASIPIVSLKPRDPEAGGPEDGSPKEETSVLETVSVNGHNTDNYGRRPRKRRRRKASGASQTAPAQ
ncbi:MAG TPA: cell division topological specificity factor MinE [Candidatus Acidoferrales bacterium]|nr:cell division topological specificity factor MinE [Candidatus Acidoferrales bacterium]